jgi:hypothetical protein
MAKILGLLFMLLSAVCALLPSDAECQELQQIHRSSWQISDPCPNTPCDVPANNPCRHKTYDLGISVFKWCTCGSNLNDPQWYGTRCHALSQVFDDDTEENPHKAPYCVYDGVCGTNKYCDPEATVTWPKCICQSSPVAW